MDGFSMAGLAVFCFAMLLLMVPDCAGGCSDQGMCAMHR